MYLECISSETAEWIWLKFCRVRGPSQTLFDILVVIAAGVSPGEQTVWFS